MASQPLTGIVSVTVQVSPVPVGPPALNTGLIVGPSAVITPAQRVVLYPSTGAMLTGGFVATDPEYLAAELYFAQAPQPVQVAIGRQDTDAQSTTTLAAALVDAQAYTALDVVALTVAIETGATVTIGTGGTTQQVVTSAAAAIGATTIAVDQFYANAAYAIGVAVASNTPETLLTAVQACQAASNAWYAVYACGAVDADTEAIATWALGLGTPVAHFNDTADPAVLNGQAGNVMATLQTAKDRRSWGIWSATAHAAAAVMGVAMGLANPVAEGLLGSDFDLAYKSVAGVTPDVLTTPQVATITGYNGNVYTTYGSAYELIVQGTMADGTPFDQVFNEDVVTTGIAADVMGALVSNKKVQQDDNGVTMLVDAMQGGTLARAATTGILAPGTWTGAPVLSLQTGDALTEGYAVVAADVSTLTPAQIAARTSPAIYACCIFAGAIEHVVIGVVVQL